MNTLRTILGKLMLCIAGIALLGGAIPAVTAAIVNIDFDGVRNPKPPGSTYVGQGNVDGGTTWNGVKADSRLPDGTSNNDNLTVGGNNLLDDSGLATLGSFTYGPGLAGDDGGTTDPSSIFALIGDYVYNAGQQNFTITGLGTNTTADLYFYVMTEISINPATIPGATSSGLFAGNGTIPENRCVYYPNVPVSGGMITGYMNPGQVTYGISISTLGPFAVQTLPTVVSTAPAGSAVRSNAVIQIELQDNATHVATNSIQLFLNGSAVIPAINQPAGTNVTTISYDPSGNLPVGTNTVGIIFSDDAAPPVFQTNTFSFVVISDAVAAGIVNIDFNGGRNGNPPGPTFQGQGFAGGGTTWNGLAADSWDGSANNDNLTVGGTNLLNSIGAMTTVGFTVAGVAGDTRIAPDFDPNSPDALLKDYLVAGIPTTPPTSPFTISGLVPNSFVDLYSYSVDGQESLHLDGGTLTSIPFTGSFNSANTAYYANVPVSGAGTIIGNLGPEVVVLSGLTIQKRFSGPFVKSTSPSGDLVRQSSAIAIELLDNGTQVDTNSIQLFLNGSAVIPAINKPAGTNLTTVSYAPATPLPGSTNTVKIIFSDDAAPPVFQTNTFSFVVITDTESAAIVNVDFNGTRSAKLPGPTYQGQGPAGGGTTWNGVVVDSWDGSANDDNQTVTSTNLVDSIGGTTTVGFTVVGVGGDLYIASGHPATDNLALFKDFIFASAAPAPFTISGLVPNTTAALYFYNADTAFNITVDGGTLATFTPTGFTFSEANTRLAANVQVSGTGTITGLIGGGFTIVSGFTIVNPFLGPLTIAPASGGVILSWPSGGTLQSAPAVTGPWSNVAGAISPYQATSTEAQKFYRLQQ